MNRPSETLKAISHRLAHSLSTTGGAEAVQLLFTSGLLGDGIARRDNQKHQLLHTPGSVGIWKQKAPGEKGHYIRNPEMSNEWHFWAKIGHIKPKKDKRRVVLLGESVARGYLYDPEFTPASALEHVLKIAYGSREIEVIDLARTDLGLGIKDLGIAARELEPDLLLFFAGNNWSYPEISSSLGSTALLSGGIVGLKNALAESIRQTARQTIADINCFYRAEGIPVIWVVPEFNLKDWTEPQSVPPLGMAGATEDWIRLCHAAEEALAEGNYTRAREHASSMRNFDLGLSTKTLYLLAECSLHEGRTNEARRHLEAARDALIWDCSRFLSPRAATPVQEELRAAENRPHCTVVDLPALMEQALDGRLPDRNVFLDYCHMTVRGIQIAMGAAACSIMQALGGPEYHFTAVLDSSMDAPSRVKGEAAFLAAIHNAHWYQPFERVRHFCFQALRDDRGVAHVMSEYLALQNSRTPSLMGRAGVMIADRGSDLIQHYILRYNDQLLDEVLTEAIVQCLEEVGMDVRKSFESMRREDHSVAVREIDLLDPYYRPTTSQQQEFTWSRDHTPNRHTRPNFYRAYSSISQFTFVGEEGRPVTLVITLRLPPPRSSPCAVSLSINGRLQTDISAETDWDRWEIAVPARVIRNGVNHIAIGWPDPCVRGQQAIEEAARAMSLGMTPEFYQSYGEIFEFLASAGPVGERS